MELSGLHCYIDAVAQHQPDAPAAVDAITGCWSYGELRRAAGRVAALLARHGVKAEQSEDPRATPRPVALALPRGNVWYACCYACWRLGVPVAASDDMPDKAAEAERLARLWRELRPQALLGAGAAEVVAFSKEQILQAINCENGHGDTVSDGPCSPDSVLLYTYTGGTTKHSKCVVVTHAMALWEMKNYHIVLGGKMSSSDRVLQFTSAYWGAAAFGQIDIALAFGACVVFSQSRTEGLAAVIEEYQITVLGTVPSLLRATYPGGPMTKAPSLRLVLTWGEALPVKLSKAWKEVCFMVDLLIASEYWLALYSHCDVFRDPLDGREKHLLMPLPKLQIHLLSADGDLGDEGEMILRGDTVSPGYIGSDGRICNDEGSEFFLKGLRYLRTRDKLRRVEGGCLVYCGRSGSLAKRGGQFVDLEDLAEQLQAIPGMASCALLQGERLEAFVTLEPEEVLSRLPHPVNSALNDAQKLLGPTARLHLRSRLPRHPVTGKVQRNQLEEQVSASVQRELQHLQLRTRIQWQMLRSYCSWYPVILLQVTLATLLGHLARAPATWDLLWTGPLRLLLLPYLWAALAYTPLLPLPTKRRTRAFYEGLSISPPEMLMLVTGLVPWNWICTLQVLACALLVFYRREKAQHALPFLGFALVMPWLPFLAQLALCAGCVLLDVLLPHDDRYVLPSLPLCFYLVMPKWFSDEVRWYLKRNRLRKLLYFWLLPKPPWDSSWFWEDRDRSFTILNGCGTVRVAKANHGLSLTVEFAETVPVLSRSGRSGPAVRPSALEQESPLAGLVRRAGGDPSGGLRLDSLQGTVLAEMIRKELRRSISVADVLRSKDLLELQEKLQSCDCAKMEPEKEDSAVSPSSTYRLWMLQFPRHPVDWCLRYEAGRHLDVPAMQRAVDRLVARHSALRTSETPDEPLREIMDKAAAMWQLWRSCCGSSCYWRYVRGPTASALFALWPRTVVHASGHVEVKVPELEDGRVRRERWDWASHDQYIGGLLDDLLRPRRWPFEVAVAPLFYGQATGRNAIEAALAKPPSEVAWYIYCSITHAYSDGLCGQALFADLLRFYEEELHGTLTPLEPAPEPLALLQRRLWRSFNRDAAEQPEPNEDLYHESICDAWGKRSGMSRRIYFHANVTRTLRLAASNVFGCSTDLAWLTVIMCAMFRLFPQQQRMMLILKASCRDGPGEGQMVAFLSEARVFALDTGDPSSATILEVHQQIQRVRLSRDWRAPEPFEFGLCVYVNIVSAMVNSLPSGYRHVVRETSPPSYWDSVAYSHLNLRIDQLRMDEWDFRIFHHDSAWGWDWPTSFAYHLGEVIRRMAMDPLSPLMEVEAVRTNPGTNGSGPGQARMACEDSPAAPRQKRSKEDAASGENGPPAKSLTYYSDEQSHLLLTIAASGDAAHEAAQLGRNVSEIGKSLSHAMSIATSMFLDPTCSEPQLTDLEWFQALTNAEDQLLQASKATTLFLQIASNYNVAESKVQLTLLADDATLSLRHLLEGSKATGLVSPPTQELVDQIIAVKGVWQSMRAEFTKAIFETSVSISSVSEVARLTKLFTDGISEAVSLYVRTAISAGTSIPAYTVHLASRQRTKAQNLVKKAIMVNLGYSVQENWAAFNATNDLLMETHWTLLEGAAAKTPYPAVNATTDLCIIQQMWTALGVYDQLQAAADRVLRGEKSLANIAIYAERFDVEMGVAVEWYKSPGSATCDNFVPTLDQWKGLILEVARIRSLSQELSSAYLLVELNMSTPEALLEGRRALDVSVKRLRFGSHAPAVPAPPVQYVLDRLVVDVLPAVDAFHDALEGEDVATIFNQSSAVLRHVDDFLETFFVEGAADAVAAPMYRMQLASRQIMLVQSIFRDYVLLSGNATAQTSMSETIANFEAVHRALREGGRGVAKLSLVRQDVLKQWDRISAVWGTFRQQVLVIPGALSDRVTVLGSVQATLNSLVAELEVGVQLFGIQDEEMKGEYIWPIIAYSCFVVCMLGCICAAIYAVKRYSREREEWSAHAHDKV